VLIKAQKIGQGSTNELQSSEIGEMPHPFVVGIQMDGAIVCLNPDTLQRRLMEQKRFVDFPWLKVIAGDYSWTMVNRNDFSALQA
jgi:hypothetical protein